MYKLHRCHFARRVEVRITRIGVRHFGNHFPSIIHRHQEGFVEVALGQLLYLNAGTGANRSSRDSSQFLHVEFDIARRELLGLVP